MWLRIGCLCIATALASCQESETYFIPGTGTLTECSEAPIANLDGTCWFDSGTITIGSAGCEDAMPGDVLTACALAWSFTQTGNDVSIIVDGEYRIEGRLCGEQLQLRGGWWLPVQDGDLCTYEEDSADEVGIQAEGNVLTYSPADDQSQQPQLTGTLAVRGSCSAEYAVVLQPGGGCFF